MSEVTIEGTTMPAAGVLARGQRKTVTYTPRIERLVKKGFVKIVGFSSAPTAAAVTPNGHVDDTVALPVIDAQAYSEIDYEEADGDTPPFPSPSDAVAPPRNASKDDWREFLDSQGIPYPEDAGRDDLVAGWTQISQQRAGGS